MELHLLIRISLLPKIFQPAPGGAAAVTPAQTCVGVYWLSRLHCKM